MVAILWLQVTRPNYLRACVSPLSRLLRDWFLSHRAFGSNGDVIHVKGSFDTLTVVDTGEYKARHMPDWWARSRERCFVHCSRGAMSMDGYPFRIPAEESQETSFLDYWHAGYSSASS